MKCQFFFWDFESIFKNWINNEFWKRNGVLIITWNILKRMPHCLSYKANIPLSNFRNILWERINFYKWSSRWRFEFFWDNWLSLIDWQISKWIIIIFKTPIGVLFYAKCVCVFNQKLKFVISRSNSFCLTIQPNLIY